MKKQRYKLKCKYTDTIQQKESVVVVEIIDSENYSIEDFEKEILEPQQNVEYELEKIK